MHIAFHIHPFHIATIVLIFPFLRLAVCHNRSLPFFQSQSHRRHSRLLFSQLPFLILILIMPNWFCVLRRDGGTQLRRLSENSITHNSCGNFLRILLNVWIPSFLQGIIDRSLAWQWAQCKCEFIRELL